MITRWGGWFSLIASGWGLPVLVIVVFLCFGLVIGILSRRAITLPVEGRVAPVKAFFIMATVFAIVLVSVQLGAIMRWVATKRDPVQTFVDYFDADVNATFPDLAEVARQDHEFHTKLLVRSKKAFIEDGWNGVSGVNAVIFPFLETQLAVYEDDEALQALAIAHVDVLTHLRRTKSFRACKMLGLAPKTGPALPPHATYMLDLVPSLLAIPKKFVAGKARGQTWHAPSHDELVAIWLTLRNGRQPLSDVEVRAMASKTMAEPVTYCQASIKIMNNLLDWPLQESTQLYRVLLAHAEDDNWIADLLR